MNVLMISGSTRAGSLNTSLLRALARELPDHADTQLLDPRLLKAVPPYDADDEATHAGSDALVAIRTAVAAADVVVIATPEYNGSVPGHLKNVLDWVSRPIDQSPFRNKPLAVISGGPGQFGALWANNDLRRIAGVLGARVIERQVAVPAADAALGAGDTITNAGVARQLSLLATDIAAAATAAPAARVAVEA